jgi:hypothetical protein
MTPVLKPTQILGLLKSVELLKVDGYIVYTTVLPSGDAIAVTRSGSAYTLYQIDTAGHHKSTPLFTGQGEYRFGFFDGRYLVVNPVDKTQLLILDIGGTQLEQVAMMPTAAFRGKAVFATTPTHLIRVVQGTITRGKVRHGSLVEEVVGTARRGQTWLWASPHNEMIAGYYRFFDALHLFLLNEKGAYYELDHPVLQPGESLNEIEAIFGRNAIAYLLKINRGGKQYIKTFVVDEQGKIIEKREYRIGSAEQFESIHGRVLSHHTILHPTDGGILKENRSGKHLLADTADLVSAADNLHLHPNGLLIQQASALYLLKEK